MYKEIAFAKVNENVFILLFENFYFEIILL